MQPTPYSPSHVAVPSTSAKMLAAVSSRYLQSPMCCCSWRWRKEDFTTTKKKTTKHFVVQHQSKVLTESEVLPGALTKTTTLSLSRSWNPTKLIPQTLKATDPTNPKIMAPKTKVIWLVLLVSD
jgi:hypothetical protein